MIEIEAEIAAACALGSGEFRLRTCCISAEWRMLTMPRANWPMSSPLCGLWHLHRQRVNLNRVMRKAIRLDSK